MTVRHQAYVSQRMYGPHPRLWHARIVADGMVVDARYFDSRRDAMVWANGRSLELNRSEGRLFTVDL